jgi:MFS superfamily sulfate permease-like transporter
VSGELQSSIVQFSDNVTISNISDAHDILLAALEHNNSITIDIDGLEEADLTFVQLIESARRSAAEGGRSIQLRQAAQGAVLQVLQRGGFLDPDDRDRTNFWLQGAN